MPAILFNLFKLFYFNKTIFFSKFGKSGNLLQDNWPQKNRARDFSVKAFSKTTLPEQTF